MLILSEIHKNYMKPVRTASIAMIIGSNDNDNWAKFLQQDKLVGRLKEFPNLYFEVLVRTWGGIRGIGPSKMN